jgi:hypothetical protein
MLVIIGIIFLLISYIVLNFACAFCVHHIDKPKRKGLYSYFLKLLNKRLNDEDDFQKLMFSWVICMQGIIFLGLGIIFIFLYIMTIAQSIYI